MKHKKLTCVLCDSPQEHHLFVADGADFEYGVSGRWDYYRCDRCGLVRIDPMPEQSEIASFYPADYHGYVPARSNITRTLNRLNLANRRRRYERLLPDKAGRLLDVGSSDGAHFSVWESNRRLRCVGVEIDPIAARRGREAGRDIIGGTFEDASFGTNSRFDIVVANHLLEHLIDPAFVVKKIHSLLKPGGSIVGEVPNIASLDFGLFGRLWGGNHWPRHLHQFSPETLRSLLAQAGFLEIVISPSFHTGHWALSIQNFLEEKRGCKHLSAGRAWYYPFLLLLAIPIQLLAYPKTRTGIMGFTAKR